MVYLDAAATTKPHPMVVEAMIPYFYEKWYNPSSLYGVAHNVKKDIEEARSVVGRFVNASKDEIFFTSGGSESNCWVVQGFVSYCRKCGKTPSIITSTIEHKSIMSCVENIGTDVHFVGVDEEGFIDINALKGLIEYVKSKDHEVLVSIQFANNELGTIQRIKEIADVAHSLGAIFHTDAVQAFGQIPIDVEDFGIDMLSASGHKIGTPKGIGILYKRKGINIDPVIYGSQMDGLRGGTENVPYIIGMAKAVRLIQRDEDYDLRLSVLRNNFITKLKALGCKVNGSLDERLPNNINVTFAQNITGESLIYILDMSNIYISAGSACNSTSIEPSYVLKAIGLSDDEANRTIRITLPGDITMEKIDKAVEEIEKSIKLIEINGD